MFKSNLGVFHYKIYISILKFSHRTEICLTYQLFLYHKFRFKKKKKKNRIAMRACASWKSNIFPASTRTLAWATRVKYDVILHLNDVNFWNDRHPGSAIFGGIWSFTFFFFFSSNIDSKNLQIYISKKWERSQIILFPISQALDDSKLPSCKLN